jgi:uncharacterized membrane protein
MERAYVIYGAYMLFFVLLVGLILATPILSFGSSQSALYSAFSYTCHQKISRSLCVFSGATSYWLGDCTLQNGTLMNTVADRTTIMVSADGITGYKMPVCSRDFGIYGAMLFGGLLYPFVRRLDNKEVWPAIWLVLALVPIGLDGGIQLLSDMNLLPFIYESSNAMRLFTGGLAGLASAFYAIPLLMNMFGAGEEKTAERPKPSKPAKTKAA